MTDESAGAKLNTPWVLNQFGLSPAVETNCLR